MPGRAGRDVQDPARSTGSHAGQHELGQLERGPHLDLEHQAVVALREVLDRFEVGDGGVVHEHVDGAELALGGLHEAAAVLLLAEVGGDADGGAARLVDRLHRAGHAARERVVALFDGAGRHGDGGAVSREAAGDELADATAGTGNDDDFALQAHGLSPSWVR